MHTIRNFLSIIVKCDIMTKILAVFFVSISKRFDPTSPAPAIVTARQAPAGMNKLMISISLLLFSGVYIYEIITNGFLKYVYPAYILLSVQFVIFSLYYYYLQLKSDEYIILKHSSEFWWVAGTLLFYFANTTCDIFDDDLKSVMIAPLHQHLTYFIYKILNIILYGFWSYSFICRKWLIRK